ncbi:uncharacterized protein LOC130294141 [Hyla sarda]|uniref:uncharacterized protein LOC130294141 n=1 Tax=Hyla sarda TaxID=327740 RepID=UPI0024C2D4F6|nr:uncharacterized protein LOC130294141 [Hyla sarda]
MNGLIEFPVPAIILKLHDWMPVIYRRVQENYGVRYRVGIMCALLFVFWTQGKRLFDYRECILLIASSAGYTVIISRFINSFFYDYFSLLLLFTFCVFWVSRSEETEEKKNVKVEESNEKPHELPGQTSSVARLMNAEKFLKLFQSLLFEEETLGTELEPIEEKICKLKVAAKELKKVQITIDSLKTQFRYNFNSSLNESRRFQDTVDNFDHTKTYMELRSYMLNKVHRQLMSFSRKGMALKTWLSEALEFQEKLHSTTCSSYDDIQQHLSLSQGIGKDSEVIPVKLAEYEHSTQSTMVTLQMMTTCSDIFYKALKQGTSSQTGIRKWHDILAVSLTEEATQVAQRFSTLTKLNKCYQTHLDGLVQQFQGGTITRRPNSEF